MDNINFKIEYFKNQIECAINEAKLPIGVVKLIVENICNQINQLYMEQLQIEMSVKKEEGNDKNED